MLEMRDNRELEIREYYLINIFFVSKLDPKNQAALLIYIVGFVGVCLDAKLHTQSNSWLSDR